MGNLPRQALGWAGHFVGQTSDGIASKTAGCTMPERRSPTMAAQHLYACLPAHASGQWGIPLAHNKTTYFCFYDNRKPGHHARRACLHMHAAFALKRAIRQQQPRHVVVSCVTYDF